MRGFVAAGLTCRDEDEHQPPGKLERRRKVRSVHASLVADFRAVGQRIDGGNLAAFDLLKSLLRQIIRLTRVSLKRSLSPFHSQNEIVHRDMNSAMDWLTLVTVVCLLMIGGTAFYYFHVFLSRTRKQFCETQPNLRISNLSAMNAGNELTLSPEIENMGRGVAYDCVMHLGGWDGNFAIKKVYPHGPRYQKHVASIVLGPGVPLRGKAMTNGYLRLSYRDHWGLKYECWYPVTQTRTGSASLYNIQIDLDHPELTVPNPSVWEMWKLLRNPSRGD